MRLMLSVRDVVARPVRDYLDGLQAAVTGHGIPAVALVVVAFAAAWWVYVPVHEMLHAYGCLWTGGTVTQLDIDPIYGAALLQRWFPFVHVGSEYAGRLSGFDTHGNDLIYLATDAAPFVLTVVLGVPLLQSAATGERGWMSRCLRLGVGLPIAYAPFISLVGDYYEMGSIVVSRAWSAVVPDFAPARWRSDDIFRLIDTLRTAGDAGPGDALGVAASFLVGTVLAFATYAAGTWCAGTYRRIGAR